MINRLTDNVKSNIVIDFRMWCSAEEELHRLSDENKNTPSMIQALSRINIGYMNSSGGLRIVQNMLSVDNELHGTGMRMYRFSSSCILKYGFKVMEQYKKLCFKVMREVYYVRQDVIDELTKTNECCWMIVMFTII